MIAGLDSSFDRPSAAQVALAWQAGVRVWGGYVATRPNVGLAATWGLTDFDGVRSLGGVPLAMCSGWDDPAALRALAQQWGVRLCLDLEDGIRGDGSWVDGFLAASGAGLYGQNSPLGSVHYHAAPFHIGSYYLGSDPGTSWYSSRPADGSPCGWQWQSTHSEFGLSVDRGWYDDWFGGDMTQDQINAFARVLIALFKGRTPFDQAELNSIVGQLTPGNFEATVTALELAAEYSGAAGVAELTLKTRLDRLPAAANAATATHTHAQTSAHTGPPDAGT